MTNANLSTANAKHIEIGRRYAWHTRQRNGGSKLTRTQLMPRIRLRELERIFQRRYGRFLPDDDAGRDDLVLAAHHVANLGDDAVEHIIAWARAWAPWMPKGEAKAIAEHVAVDPLKFTADVLAWRIRLSMVERTELKITTIGAFDCSKAERAEERRRKNNEAKRIKRAEKSTGRRGRPRKTGIKNAGTAVDAYAVPAFSDHTYAAREASESKLAADAFTKQNLLISAAANQKKAILKKGPPSAPPSISTRAKSPVSVVRPPAGIVDQAVEIARQHTSNRLPTDRTAVRRLVERFWPGYVKSKVATAIRFYGYFSPERDLRDWIFTFRTALEGEAVAIERNRARRRKWKQDRARAYAAGASL